MKTFFKRPALFSLLLLGGAVIGREPASAQSIRPALSDTTLLPRQTMSRVRRMQAASYSEGVYITDAGQQGIFVADPSDAKTPDDSAMTLITPGGLRLKRVSENGIVNARWFGAIPGDGRDDWAAIQKAVDFCTANGDKYTTVHLGPGWYTISQPIMLYHWGGNSYGFHSTSLEGESPFWGASGTGTILQCTFKDKFAIGVELGKGNKISRLKIVGGFKPPFTDKFSFYRSTFDEFKDPTCRDSHYSPYAGIVIDPFSNGSGQIPADGGYPGYASWYRGNGSINGSTGINIEDVSIQGFVVGVCSSPNSFTRNAEMTYINKIQFADTKLCISGSQDQEKGNVVSDLGCWGTTHTVFATGLYGALTPGNWYVENANIAGYVNRLVYNPQSGYFASHFKNIFSEMLGRLGVIYSNQGTTVESSEFGFAYYTDDAGQYISPQVDCSGVTFIGCNLRMYGTFKPVTLNGNATYMGCSFETVPFTSYVIGDQPAFIRCTIGSNHFVLGVSGITEHYPSDISGTFAYGHYIIAVGAATFTVGNAHPAEAYPIHLSGAPTTLNIVLSNGMRSAVVPLSLNETGRVRKGDVICSGGNDKTTGVIGIVTDVTATSFTLAYISSWVTTGQSYHLSVFLPLSNISFLGDLTAGSNRVSNVRLDLGNFDRFLSLGGLMSCRSFMPAGGDPEEGPTLFRITGYDPATHTATIDQPSGQTAQGLYFSNANAVKDLHTEDHKDGFAYLGKHHADELLQEGGRIFIWDTASKRTLSYVVTKSGFYDAGASHDSRQAQWVRESP